MHLGRSSFEVIGHRPDDLSPPNPLKRKAIDPSLTARRCQDGIRSSVDLRGGKMKLGDTQNNRRGLKTPQAAPDLPSSEAQRGPPGQEERHVGAEVCRDLAQSLEGEWRPVDPVERAEGDGRVAGSAAQARAQRNA